MPPGFVIERSAGPEVVFPMFAAFDDRGRLFVAESSGLDLYAEISALTRKCRVRLLEDRDADGYFERSQVFADQLVFPMGLVSRDGLLYVADPPDLITLEDTDGDGRADRRTVILTGFGHKDNGSLHGLVFGPDGLLYMTMGQPDGYRLKRTKAADLPGKEGDFEWLEGTSGALIRCRADGSEPEVVCRGFENLVEIAFLPAGEIVGSDNWFQRPSDGLRDALVHLVEGGLYPMQPETGTPYPVTGEPLPPITLFPAVALSGLARYRGAAFPSGMQNSLFSAQHNARKVARHVLTRDGATFRSLDFDFVTSDDPDFHPSDVLEAADGSLLVVDTGGWYVQHCPTGKIRDSKAPGGVYRVRYATATRIDDPWGTHVDWSGATIEQLAGLLGDDRPAVRDRAQAALSARGQPAVGALASVLRGAASGATKQHAAWALAHIADGSPLPPLREVLHAADPELVALAARALALRRDRQAAAPLGKLLAHEAPEVRMAAAEALAHCGTTASLMHIWDALQGQPDRFLELALIHAAYRLADADHLQRALRDSHPRVQKAALLLLDQPPHQPLTAEPVIERLSATDAELRQTALRILRKHAEWASHALRLLEEWMRKPALSEEENRGLAGLVLSFEADQEVAELVGRSIANGDGKTPAERRLLLLDAIGQSSLPEIPSTWVRALEAALESRDAAVRERAVRTATVLRVPQLRRALARRAEDTRESPVLRVEALRAVVTPQEGLSAWAFELLIGRLRSESDSLGRVAAAEVLAQAGLGETQVVQVLQTVHGDALISPAVLWPLLRRSGDRLSSKGEPPKGRMAAALLDYLEAAVRGGWSPPPEQLRELLEKLPEPAQTRAHALLALPGVDAERQRARLTKFEPLLSGGDALRGREVFFGKKVACASCHRIGSDGAQVGPDLTKIAAFRSGRDLLESVVLPSSTFAQGYEHYLLVTDDGRMLSGMIARQTADTLVLRDSSGAETRLRKDEIEELSRQPTSLMPDGLAEALTAAELRDVLAFLLSLK
ncbi:MAG: HEAT repeat domain-containing protein [Planctomycetes bacterium]|nr:HEAT repeat domain-containing protein [Planctomycetota bacterium]